MKRIIIVIILGLICLGGLLLFGNHSNSNMINSLDGGALVEGNGIAEGVITIDCSKPQKTGFYSGSHYNLNQFTIS